MDRQMSMDRPSAPPPARGTARALVLALSILGSAFLAPRPALAQTIGLSGGFLELTDVFFAEGDRIFGANEIITVSGTIPFIPQYLCQSGGDGEGPFDFFPSANLYVIKDDGNLADGAPLVDVLSTPNRITGVSAQGLFVEQTVAVAKPTGNLPAGTYDVVMDQCEDDVFNEGIDIHLGAGAGFAFKVFVPEGVGEIDFIPLKFEAIKMKHILAGTAPILSGDPLYGLCSKTSALAFQFLSEETTVPEAAVGFFDESCRDLAAHYEGLAADPPDPNFTAFAELGAIPYRFLQAPTELERALLRIFNIFAEQEAIAEAFLTTLERVQGAQQADDHEFLSLQLRHLNKYINLLVGGGGNLLRFFVALEALERAVQNEPGVAGTPEANALLVVSRQMRRAIGGMFFPLGPRFKRDPSDPNALIPFGLQSWIITYLGLDPFLNTAGLFSIADFRASVGLAPIDFQHPVARTTGPYTAPPGRDVSFDALPSEDPNSDPLTFAWDLDMDGLFDDSPAQLVEQAFAEPGTRLVGLKVTDPAGNSDVAYVQLKIGDTMIQDIISIQHLPRDLKRIAPDGTVAIIKEDAIPVSTRTPHALQVDVTGEIFILDVTVLNEGGETRPVIHHLDANGEPIATVTPDDIEALIGREIAQVFDMRLDGRGDFLLAANVEGLNAQGDPDPEFGPVMVIHLARDFAAASVVAEGILRQPGSVPGLAIGPEGEIVLSDVGHPDTADQPVLKGLAGISILDPDDGSVNQTVPADGAVLPSGLRTSVGALFGGVPLGAFRQAGTRIGGGIEVDRQGNYITGQGHRGPANLWRVPTPPEVTTLSQNITTIVLGFEVFPLLPESLGGLFLSFTDVALDAGGDAIVVGRNLSADVPPSNHNSAWRISPASEFFLVADLGQHATARNQGGFAFDVTREVREVTPRDIPALPVVPELLLETLQVEQDNCPLSATIRATLTNTGASASEAPLSIAVFKGDPLQGGEVIGTATVQAPIAPGASVQVVVDWLDPAPGVHEVFALGQGTNVPFTAGMICVPAPPDQAITLRPLNATLDVGETHSLSASIFDLYGDPIPGLGLSFSITGANIAAGVAATDVTGTASFSYSGSAAGEDTIAASVFDEVSNQVTANWNQAAAALACDIDADADVDIGDIMAIFGAVGTAAGPGDPRDADRDGLITINDARGCVLQCTNSMCAP